MKIYRGAAAAARHYVEADRSRADDYYLAEGSGVAMRFAAGIDNPEQRVTIKRRADMDGATYEQWVAGYVGTGAAKGRLGTDDKGVRFVEVTVNGPKTWSLAAALHPEIAAAYDAAQIAAAEEIIGWLASHATTRVGPRGRQVQVPVEQIEAAVVRHFTSRAGGARVALIGDRHQLPAVGRGGGLDLAARYAADRCIEFGGVRRFTDPAYADLSLRMRSGVRSGEVLTNSCAEATS